MKIEDYRRIWGTKQHKNTEGGFYNSSFHSNYDKNLVDEENKKFFESYINAQK